MIRLQNILKASLQDVLKMSWRRFCKTSWRRLENVLKTSWQDVLKTSWKRLEDVLKTYSQDEYIGLNQDVFWSRMTKANIFVLIKTSSEDEDERRLQDVFIKTNVCWVCSNEFFNWRRASILQKFISKNASLFKKILKNSNLHGYHSSSLVLFSIICNFFTKYVIKIFTIRQYRLLHIFRENY